MTSSDEEFARRRFAEARPEGADFEQRRRVSDTDAGNRITGPSPCPLGSVVTTGGGAGPPGPTGLVEQGENPAW
jgi:hypothetical protein